MWQADSTDRGQVDAVVDVVEGHVHALKGQHHALLAGIPFDAGQAVRSAGGSLAAAHAPQASGAAKIAGAGAHGPLACPGRPDRLLADGRNALLAILSNRVQLALRDGLDLHTVGIQALDGLVWAICLHSIKLVLLNPCSCLHRSQGNPHSLPQSTS